MARSALLSLPGLEGDAGRVGQVISGGKRLCCIARETRQEHLGGRAHGGWARRAGGSGCGVPSGGTSRF